MRRIQVTIVSKEAGEAIDYVLDSILDDMFKSSQIELELEGGFDSLKQNIGYKYHENYDIYHASCYHQYVNNFCGYHATFANVCCLQILENSQERYDIKSAASYWSFKKSIENFLFEYRNKHKLKTDVWPWRTNDILYGDFERTYNNLFKTECKKFLTYKNHSNLEMMDYTWEFQFKNLVCNEASRKEFEEKAAYFQKYNKKNVLLVFTIMLGITNHWTCLIAIKFNGRSEFWFFDSRNLDYLNFSKEDIDKHIEELNQQKIRQKKPVYDQWRKWVICNSMIDTQISLQLIVKCLKGQQKIQRYHYNRQFCIFADHYTQVQKNRLEEHFVKGLVDWSVSYKFDLRRFFGVGKIRKEDLYAQNRRILEKMANDIIKHKHQHRDLKLIGDYIQSKL